LSPLLGESIAGEIIVEIDESEFVQLLLCRSEVRPMEFTGTRKPPSRPSRQEEVVETVRVEITDAVTTIGIDLYNIARAYDDVFPSLKINRVVPAVSFESLVWEDVFGYIDPPSGLTTNLDCVAPSVLKSVLDIVESMPCVATVPEAVGKPRATIVVAMYIELMSVRIEAMVSATFKNKIASCIIAARIAIGRDRVPVEVKDILGNLRPRADSNINPISSSMAIRKRPWMLVVVDEVVMYAYLLWARDAPARSVQRRGLIRTCLILNSDCIAAPARYLCI
jgi:hypothetical protein